MRLCTVEDFQRVNSEETYHKMVAIAGEKGIICPDLEGVVVTGSLTAG